MEVVYLVTIVIAFCQSIRSGVAQIVPCFAVSLGYLAVLELFYRPFDMQWMNEWYSVAAGGYMAFRAMTVAEAFLIHSHGHPRRCLLAVSTVMLTLACAAIMTWQVTGPTALMSAIQARRVLTVGLFAFLLIYCLLRWSMCEWRWSFASKHILTQTALSAVLAGASLSAIAVPEWWFAINTAAYAMKAIILAAWTAFSIPGPPLAPAGLPRRAATH